MTILSIAIILASFYSIYHLWKFTSCGMGMKIFMTLLLLFTGFVGLLVYWIYYFASGNKSCDSSEEENGNAVSSNSEMYNYSSAVRDYNSAASTMQGKELEDRYNYLFVNFMLNGNMSGDEKCRLVELNEQKISEYFTNPLDRTLFYITAIKVCYIMLERMYGDASMMVAMQKNEFLKDIDPKSFKPKAMTTYLGDIMSLAGCFYSPKGTFELNHSIFKKYNMPDFIDLGQTEE